MSVGFTDEDEETMAAKGYRADKSDLGYVYYPNDGVHITDEIEVNYVEYPWITRFEVCGITAEKK